MRQSGRVFDVRIDGRPVATGTLPVGWLHRRRLVKYTADPTLVVCNQAHDGPVATVDPQAPGDVELDPRSGGIVALRARNGGHRARLELAPALHVAHLRPRQTIEGTWRLGIDSDPAVVGGFWTAERRQDVVKLVLDGEAAGQGPTGWIMPAYIARDRDVAAKNREDAVIEYLLLSRCHYLVHKRVESGEDGPAERSSAAAHQYASRERSPVREA